MSRAVRRYVTGFVAGIACLWGCSLVQAQAVYSFNHIADVTLNYPAINDSGVVAFEGRLTPSFTTGIFTGTGGPLTTIATAALDSTDECTINNGGQVAFVASPTGLRFGAYRGSGGALTTISATQGSVYGPMAAISGDGTVTFNANLIGGSSGIFSGSGGSVTPLFLATKANGATYGGSFDYATASKSGPIAYETFVSTTNPQIVANSSGNLTLVASASGPFGGFQSISINNTGTVAMVASFTDTNAGVYVGDGSGLVEIVPLATLGSPQLFTTALAAAINDADQLAIQATTSTGHQGIFTGPDPLLDKVIQIGDPLNGSTITSIEMGTESINDFGQITFWAALANGEQGVFTATPTPEPGCCVLLVVSAGLLLKRRR